MKLTVNSNFGSFDYDTTAAPSDQPNIVKKIAGIVQPELVVSDLNVDYKPYGKPVNNYSNIVKGILVLYMFVFWFGMYNIMKAIFKKGR